MFHSRQIVYLPGLWLIWPINIQTDRERKGTRIGRPILACSPTTWLPGLPLGFLPWIDPPPAPELLSTCGPTNQSQPSLLRPRPLIGREQWLRRVLLAYLAIAVTVSRDCPLVWKAKKWTPLSSEFPMLLNFPPHHQLFNFITVHYWQTPL